jgi:type VI secretion system secreted protein Hcp
MAYESYIKIKGSKQGQLKGSSPKAKRADFLDVLSFKMGGDVPVDANNWKPKGSRQHRPLVVTVEACAASPQLLQALWTSEVLSEVVLEQVNRTSAGDKEQVKERITLTDAIIVSISRYSSAHAKEKLAHDVDHLEDIEFRFRQIMVENPLASTSATDDWNTPGG